MLLSVSPMLENLLVSCSMEAFLLKAPVIFGLGLNLRTCLQKKMHAFNNKDITDKEIK